MAQQPSEEIAASVARGLFQVYPERRMVLVCGCCLWVGDVIEQEPIGPTPRITPPNTRDESELEIRRLPVTVRRAGRLPLWRLLALARACTFGGRCELE